MKQIGIIMQYTFNDAIRKKAFKISTVIVVLLIALLCALPRVIASFDDGDSSAEEEQTAAASYAGKCYYIDDQNLIPGGAEALQSYFINTEILTGSGESLAQYKDEIGEDGTVSAIVITKSEASAVPGIQIITKDFMSGISGDGDQETQNSLEAAGTPAYGETLMAASVSDPVYFNSAGERVIQWDLITVPDWIERDLLPVNEYSRPGIYLDDVDGIVVHYTGNPGTTAEQNRSYFENLASGADETYASSHFVIGIDGTIIQCVPLSEVAYASNDRNYDTISIECCHEDESGEFTQATYDSLVRLTSWLADTFLIDRDGIIRHYDVTGKICPKYFVDNEDAWTQFLDDVEAD